MKVEIKNFIDRGIYRKFLFFEGELFEGSYVQIVEVKLKQIVKKYYYEC